MLQGWGLVRPSCGVELVMTRDQVVAWLKIHARQVERLGIPCLDLGRKTKRYLVTDVSAWLDSKRRGRQ